MAAPHLTRRRLSSLLLAGIPGQATLGGVRAAGSPLVLAVGRNPLFAPVQLAAQLGHFAAEDLDMRVIECLNGQRCLQHLTDGEAQIATVADTPLALALHAGRQAGIVATFSSSTRDTILVARTDRGIHSPADLAGKRIGVVRGTSAHYFTNVFLLLNGVPRDAVRLIFLDPGRGAEPLMLGEVDAASLYRPNGPQALQQLGAKGMQLQSPRPYAAMGNLVAQPGLSQDTLLRVLRAVLRSLTLLNSQPAQAQAQLAARWKTDATQAALRLEGYDFRLRLEQTLLTTLEAASRWAVREGLVDSNVMPDYLELIRVDPLRALDPHAVTVVK